MFRFTIRSLLLAAFLVMSVVPGSAVAQTTSTLTKTASDEDELLSKQVEKCVIAAWNELQNCTREAINDHPNGGFWFKIHLARCVVWFDLNVAHCIPSSLLR